MNKYIIGGFLIMVSISSCIKEEIVENNLIEIQPLTKSILPEVFDWENADWMPTPPGQAQIPMIVCHGEAKDPLVLFTDLMSCMTLKELMDGASYIHHLEITEKS